MSPVRECFLRNDECSDTPWRASLPDGRVVCNTHYQRWYRTGDPETPTRKKTPKKEIEAWVAKVLAANDDQCWIWPFRKQPTRSMAYGEIGVWRNSTAPRVLLRLAKGDPPDESYVACHTPECTGKPLCVNPNHLYWGTQLRNMADKVIDGTHIHGGKVWSASVSDDVAQAIWNAYGTQKSIAERFGVSQKVVENIKNSRTYQGIDRSQPAGGGSGTRRKSKLTDEMGIQIIPDPRPQLVIAREHGIGVATVNGIKHGLLLPHLDRSNVAINKTHGDELLDDETSQEIIEAEGSQMAIAKRYGVSEHTVWGLKNGTIRKYLDRSKVVINGPGRPKGFKGQVTVSKVDLAQAQEIYDDGRLPKELAALYEVSEATIRRIKEGKTWPDVDRSKPPGWKGRPENRGAA